MMYSWCYRYVHASVSRALLYTPLQIVGKPSINQTSGKPCVTLLNRKTHICRSCHGVQSNARETLACTFPQHQLYSAPSRTGACGTPWRVTMSNTSEGVSLIGASVPRPVSTCVENVLHGEVLCGPGIPDTVLTV
jgi:hypothetical protein